ncbi:MAG TPA: carboxypeptidase-like regulatory domain-containing protein [Xanthobacteraceae bacterium]|nr:carboxypeptidase-like regulatory domain-containing protein [Xanthobacteraceae bacterium]
MMKLGNVGFVAVAMVSLALLLPLTAWAGGELADEDHDDHGDTTKGPYGFVKDSRGSPVPEATVMVDIKNRGQLVTQTNILGAYKIPAFGIEIKAEDVTIGCKKDGYKQVSVVLREGLNDPSGAFEVECTLQKQ